MPENCTTGVIQDRQFRLRLRRDVWRDSSRPKGHLRAIADWDFTLRFMGFLVGGLAIGELGPGGIQVGGIINDSSPAQQSAGSVTSTYDRRTLYGYSWGGGIQAKLNE